MCTLRCQMVRVGVAVVAIVACGAVSAKVVRVYEWSENGGTPVISNASPPTSVKQYTIRTMQVPARSADQRARIEHDLAAYRAVLTAPVPKPDAPVTLALGGDPGLPRACD